MRIVIEALGLLPGRTGGLETYVRRLVASLRAVAPGHEYLAIVGPEARGSFPGGQGGLQEWVPDRKGPFSVHNVRYAKSFWQWAQIGRRLRDWKPAVYHCTMSFPRPAWGARNMVLTVHDILHDIAPQWFGRLDGLERRLTCRLGARRAARIIADSHHVKRTIVEYYNVPEGRIDVVHLGVDHSVFTPADGEAGQRRDAVTPLPRDYLFYPASTLPHKNHVRLLEALAILRDEHRLTPPLVLTGVPRWANDEMMEAVQRWQLENQVSWLGYVDDNDLVTCYRGAAALAFPSLHEGFGLPILEAMAVGCPAACSKTTAAGEVAGDAALTFDPLNPPEIAAQLARILTDQDLRRDLRERGLRHAAGFTWERTAREVLRVYDRIAANGS
jgi:glycosyltransferase involved in cell wall biosynthesis